MLALRQPWVLAVGMECQQLHFFILGIQGRGQSSPSSSHRQSMIIGKMEELARDAGGAEISTQISVTLQGFEPPTSQLAVQHTNLQATASQTMGCDPQVGSGTLPYWSRKHYYVITSFSLTTNKRGPLYDYNYNTLQVFNPQSAVRYAGNDQEGIDDDH